MSSRRLWFCVFLLVVCPVWALAQEQPDIADIPSEDLHCQKDEQKRYFLIGPKKESKAPKDGYGLVVIIPGGPGTADFLPFVKRIYKNALPEGYLVAQPVAVKWTEKQEIVWPTAKTRVEGMKFTTEEFVSAMIKETMASREVNPKKVFTLSWSSSGPPAYALSLADDSVKGSFIAMSVFKPEELPSLEKAKGRPYYLYHSPDDRVCPFWMAKKAEKSLTEAGAAVKFVEYSGGHGWRGPLYEEIRKGIEWLESKAASP